MDQNTRNEASDSNWPKMSADVSLARASSKTIVLDTQRASEDGRILEVGSQLELMRTRLTSLERHVFDIPTSGVSGDMLERFNDIDRELSETSARFADLAKRVALTEETATTTYLGSMDAIDSRVAAVEDSRIAQSQEVSDLTGYLEQAFDRIAELAEVFESERGSNSTSRSEMFNAMTDHANRVDRSLKDLDQAIDALNTRLELATEKIDAANDEVVSRLTDQVLEMRRQLDVHESAISDSVSQTDEIAATMQFLASRADALEQAQINTASQIIERVDDAQAGVAHAESRLDQLEAKVDGAPDQLTTVNEEIGFVKEVMSSQADILDETVDSFAADIEAAKRTDEAQAGILADHSVLLDEVTGMVVEHAESIAAHTESAQQHEEQLAEHERLVQDALQSAADTNSRVEHVATQASAATDALAQVVEVVSDTQTAIEALDTRSTATAQRIDSLEDSFDSLVDESANSTRDQIADASTRAEQLSERMDEVDGELNELTDKVGVVSTEVASVSNEIEEVGARTETATEQIKTVAGQIETFAELTGELTHQVQHVDTRVTQVSERVAELESADEAGQQFREATAQLEFAHSRISENVAHLDEMDERVGELSDRLVEVEEGEQLQAKIGEIESSVEATKTEIRHVDERTQQTDAKLTSVDQRVSELDGQLSTQTTLVDGRIGQLEGQLSRVQEGVSAAHHAFDQQLTALEERVDARIADVEQAADPEQYLTAIKSNISDVEEHARQANEFAENLRQLQAELVQTLHEEMREQSEKLEAHASTLSSMDTTDYASAERVRLLENKIVEALQTISQLTQLQRRNTSVETQLTDTLTATNEGVVLTQRHVAALRAELEKAIGRIAQLEAAAAANGVPVAAAPPAAASAAAPAPAAVEPVTHIEPAAKQAATLGPAPEAGEADTDWFNESYTRKNAS